MKLKDFIIKNYKHNRLYGRGTGYGDSLLESYARDLDEYGIDVISREDSKTGKAIFFCYGKDNTIKVLTDDKLWQIQLLLSKKRYKRGKEGE